jgi:hypothetical protein
MKKKLLLLAMALLPMVAMAQTEEKQYYLYNIVSFEGDFTKEDFKVFYDNGTEVKRLRDEKGKKKKFKTPAGALMYFLSQGWEMYLNGATSKGSMAAGYGASSTSSYWILRKPCSKEEFEQVVKQSVVEED